MGGKSFKIFDKVEKKSEKEAFPEGEMGLRKKVSSIYVPPKAFTELTEFPEYHYLKNGLFVSKTREIYEEVMVSDHANSLRPESFFEHQLVFGEPMRGMHWYDSMTISSELGGKLWTLAELFAVKHYLENEDPGNPVLEDMLEGGNHGEWTNSAFGERQDFGVNFYLNWKGQARGGDWLMKEEKPWMSDKGGNFTDEAIEPRTGLPTELGDTGRYCIAYMGQFFNPVMFVKQSGMQMVHPGNGPHDTAYGSTDYCFRVCYKVTDEDLEEIKDGK